MYIVQCTWYGTVSKFGRGRLDLFVITYCKPSCRKNYAQIIDTSEYLPIGTSTNLTEGEPPNFSAPRVYINTSQYWRRMGTLPSYKNHYDYLICASQKSEVGFPPRWEKTTREEAPIDMGREDSMRKFSGSCVSTEYFISTKRNYIPLPRRIRRMRRNSMGYLPDPRIMFFSTQTPSTILSDNEVRSAEFQLTILKLIALIPTVAKNV